MMESNRIWRGLAAETGETDLAFTQSGCCILAESESQMAKYETWHELAREHQLDTRLLSSDEAAKLASGIDGPWRGGMLTPSDGRAEPFVAVPALARAARRLGAAVVENCAVRDVETQAGRVSAVITEQGRVATHRPWSWPVGRGRPASQVTNIGLDLPQLMVRSTVARTTRGARTRRFQTSPPRGLRIRRRDDGGYSIATGDVAEHYISAKSFQLLTGFSGL